MLIKRILKSVLYFAFGFILVLWTKDVIISAVVGLIIIVAIESMIIKVKKK